MRHYISGFAAIMLTVLSMTIPSCKEAPYYNSPSDNRYNGGTVSSLVWWDDEESLVVPAGMHTISVTEAMNICSELASGESTSQVYFIKGLVHSLVSKYTSLEAATFYMVDSPRDFSPKFEAFKVKDIGGVNFPTMEQVNGLRGSWVIVRAKLTSYNGTPETANEGAIVARSYHKVKTEGDGTEENPYTIADVLALDRSTEDEVYVRGIIRGCAGDNPATQEGLEFEPSEDPDYEGGFTKITNIVLADSEEEVLIENLVVVELPSRSEIREMLNLGDAEQVEANLNKEVIIRGKLGTFVGMHAVVNPSYAILTENLVMEPDPTGEEE